jgi:hypothetical protein
MCADRMSEETVARHVLANFMSASAHLELYLEQQSPLTDIEFQSLSLTLESLQGLIILWKVKHAEKENI